ncbi:MAG TPA: ATP-grasp domain-containing protein [Chthoniobacteraceae bacterium]|nr:ATP-grasp domain-containing protein [Chthoniobacteraceae bacterium]
MRKVLIIGAGAVQVAGIRRAREMGFHVIAADDNPDAPGLALADQADVGHVKDVAHITALAKAAGVEGIFSIAVESAVKTIAAVCHALGLPGLTPEAAENATNKQRMREAWEWSGIASPASVPCSSVNDTHAAADRLGFPVVVKPADSAGSRGVSFVASKAELPAAHAQALAHSAAGTVLVEEFMHGVEMSVEAFVAGGRFFSLALSDKIRTEPPYLLDTTVLFPSEQPVAIQDEALRMVEKAAEVLGIDSAPIHAEVMVTPNGPMMVELAARGPGFKVFTEMIPWVTGIDVVRELIRLSVGETPDFAHPLRRGAVLRFPEAPPGRVRRISGVDDARNVPGVTDLEVYCREGDVVRPLTSGADRVGHIIAMAETRAEALAAVREAETKLRIETEPQ